MAAMPNPFQFAASDAAAEQAAACPPQPPSQHAAADLSDIGQIFVGAAKLEPVEMWFENAAYPREDELLFEVLEAMADHSLPGLADMPYGMEWALDPAPLFLQRSA